jgi:exosortase
MTKENAGKLTLLTILLLALYIPVFAWMIDRWRAPDTYYSHGFLIPFISLFLIWHNRRKLESLEFKPTQAGWPIFLAGIAMYVLSAVWLVYSLAGFSLLIVIAGLILLFLGREFLRELRFSLLFLGFMIPVPMFLSTFISFRLKLIAAQLAVAAVNELGIRAIREGSVIKTAHAYLLVEDPCSGIRSLIALIALGTLMAHFSGKSRKKKIALFLSSIPIAIIANACRIVALTLISEVYGPQYITGFIHSLLGVAVFIVSLFGLTLVARLLG